MLWGLPAAKIERALAGYKRSRILAALSRWIPGGRTRNASLILLGIILFLGVYFSPTWPDAIDPQGLHFSLTQEGKAAVGLFLLAALWWIFELVPIGVTGIAVGALQAFLAIRKPEIVFGDYFHPSVLFIFAALVIGKGLSKSGLTQRVAYKMLALAGERTSMIYLGCFTIIALLTLVMAHTAVAATVFPLLMAVHSLYQEDNQPTRFGKGLFIGMAFSAGAASIVSLLGSARGALTVGFFQEMAGSEISFTQYSLYLLPLGWGMVLLIWLAMMLFFKPERPAIPGLKQRANDLVARLGPMSRPEAYSLIIVVAAVILLCCCSCLASWKFMDRTGIALLAALSLFLLKILNLQDLEEIPWNIVLLLGGAMSLGLCLWQTGAAAWLAVQAVGLFQISSWFVFVMILGFLVMVTANIIMNVAAVAFYTPVALAMAPYMGVSSELVLFTILTTAGMPFMLLIGAAPNAIAYESGQFSPREFLKIGMPISLLLIIMLGVFILFIWPLLGMPGPVRH